jgi:hypothetical protein
MSFQALASVDHINVPPRTPVSKSVRIKPADAPASSLLAVAVSQAKITNFRVPR